jgi:hypothetical protein
MMGSYRLEDDPHYQDVLFFEAHHEELLQQYPEKWIAILGQKVIASADDEFGLIPRLREYGIPPGSGALRRHLTREPDIWIFPHL